MAMIFVLSVLLFKDSFVSSMTYESALPEVLWRERCTRQDMVLNDCNWCRCSYSQYTCDARNCDMVDMFGYFNDAIQETDPGMEGHGSWRSKKTACEPGVQYQRPGTTCVCTEDGRWPNPVCRDIFRVLHPVEITKYNTPNKTQTCAPGKLHLIGCNACHCPSNGLIDPELCTKRNCTEEVLVSSVDNAIVDEIYAECHTGSRYKLGCQLCVCLRNNRLLCDNCTTSTVDAKKSTSLCFNRKPEDYFTVDCNFCHCDNNNSIYCTAKKCLPNQMVISKPIIDYELVPAPADDSACVAGSKYRKDCNTCYCFMRSGIKYYACTKNNCKYNNIPPVLHWEDCVPNSTYEVNNIICQCRIDDDAKEEICVSSEYLKVENEKAVDLASMHGYCEPMRVYTHGCNTCHCLADGKTTACTSKICASGGKETESVELIPFLQNYSDCPAGEVFRVDCNLCYCLEDGNAMCSTKKCSSHEDILNF